MERITIRQARKNDCQEILRLIQELADSNDALHQIELTVTDLLHDGFDESQPKFRSFVAESEGYLVGFMLFYPQYSWSANYVTLQTLYMTPRYRGKKLGTKMLQILKQICHEEKYQFINLWLKQRTPAVKFFEGQGAVNKTAMYDLTWHRMDNKALALLIGQKCPDEVSFRLAQKEDCSVLLSMIQELAKLLKMDGTVAVGVKDLENYGFQMQPPMFQCILAEVNGVVSGYALVCQTYETYSGSCSFLDDFFVSENARKCNLGTLLFREVAKMSLENHSRELTMIVHGWNTRAKRFFEKQGAVCIPELNRFSILC